jgi:hypothetical protein
MKRSFLAIALAAVVFAIPGCRNETVVDTETTTAATSTDAPITQVSIDPEQLGEIGAQIRERPHEAQSILAGRGLTEEEFEQLVRRVTEDPEASKKYAAAYNRTGN